MANATRPVVEIMAGVNPKRKRSPSVEVQAVVTEGNQEIKKRKMLQMKGSSTPVPEIPALTEIEVTKEAVVDPSRLRDTFESQLSLEILLKHDELRLINQELAKCQVALEQLRRCHLIPYPTAQGTPESMLNITNGSGPALARNGSVPRWAPSYGITEGPYSRHYAKWLIPDPSFDGIQPEWHRGLEGSRAGKTISEGRSTRHSFTDGMSSASKSRKGRGIISSQSLQALPSGYAQPKGTVGPCTLRRGDGQMVKLVCIDCKRFDFSSTQGFINHCRIAHKREFKSHEEAAVVSGQPIEVDEAGGIVGEEKSPVVPSTTTTTTGRSLVHPLIAATPTSKEAYSALLSRIDASLSMFSQGRLPGVTAIPSSASSTPVKANAKSNKKLIPSPETPHLSSLMRSKGIGGNLPEIISEAKRQIDFEELSSHDEDSEDYDRPTVPQRHLGSLNTPDSPPIMRVPARANMSPAPYNRPGSSKGPDAKNARTPGLSGISPRLAHATPVINTSISHVNRPARVFGGMIFGEDSPDADLDTEMMDGNSVVDLSPHTVASNNAPSLVSDDGEYDDGDDAESATSEDDDSVAEIDIEDDGVEKVVPRTVLRNRAGSGGESIKLKKEDKHVTFVSPVKDASKQVRRK